MLNPGRELDALVAEKVMGLKVTFIPAGTERGGGIKWRGEVNCATGERK